MKATKKEKGRMLDEFCVLTGYNRSYALRPCEGHRRRRGGAVKLLQGP